MKKTIHSILIMLFAAVISSCNKEDKNSKKLYRHEGRWTIDYITIQTFDTTGKKMVDSTVTAPGELVMMRTTSLDALYGYHQGVFVFPDTLGTHAASFEYVFDGERIDIRNCMITFINGTYNSVIDKKNEQQWEIYTPYINNSAPTSLYGKYSMHLTKSKN